MYDTLELDLKPETKKVLDDMGEEKAHEIITKLLEADLTLIAIRKEIGHDTSQELIGAIRTALLEYLMEHEEE